MKQLATLHRLGISMLLSVPFASQATAQTSELAATYSVPAQGSDFWSGTFGRNGLFVAHEDNCDSLTEAFVGVTAGGKGFCIEKSERATDQWEDARETCNSVGKRLPEPGEYKFTCKAAGTLGLSDMTDDFEWASNFTHWSIYTAGGSTSGEGASAFGGGGCAKGSFGWVGNTAGTNDSFPFRCVR